jgi:peptidoglycan/LPS O-acetylase OafA/YrhL
MADRSDTRRQRRWIGLAVLLVIVGIAWVVIPRAGARSPVAIILLCGLAILVMKLVERQVHKWFQRWAEKQAARTPPSGKPR